MKLSILAQSLRGQFIGDDGYYNNISIDTRAMQPGDLFFAIVGNARDGHDFIANAEKAKAAAVVISRHIDTVLPKICVPDTRRALFDLAGFYRSTTSIPFIAITGSCGKTTTRALLENILKQDTSVLASEKSFNNDLGVPLTLARLTPAHQFAVIELGANHCGEIATLTKLVKPTIAVITMAAPVHLEGFGSLENIARAKGEIFDGLSTESVAIINQDDAFCPLWKNINQHRRVITFGVHHSADIMARTIQCNEKSEIQFILQAFDDHIDIQLSLRGMHNVNNALAAAACAISLRVPLGQIKRGLETALPMERRLNEKQGFAHATIIDDSYNANPTSVRAAIEVLTRRPGESILVLGDMLELGNATDQLHRQIGEFALEKGVHYLFCYGERSKFAAIAFGKQAYHYTDQQALIDSLKPLLSDRVTVLVKGSNSMHMGKIAQLLEQ